MQTPLNAKGKNFVPAAAPLGHVASRTGLMGALQRRNLEMVTKELEENPHIASVDWRFERGAEPPSVKAVRSRCKPEIHRLLFRHRADPNEEDTFGTTALGALTNKRCRNYSWVCDTEPFAPVDQVSDPVILPWLTSSQWSVQPADVDAILAPFFDVGADQLPVDENPPWYNPGEALACSTVQSPNLNSEESKTTDEAGQQELEVASVLLAAGANPFHECSPGFTPVTMAKANGQHELARLLEFYGDVQALRAIVYSVNRPAHIERLFDTDDVANVILSFLVPNVVIPRL
eukprot:TRINITY_DN4663_c0_g1_i2.p1 TRINITY_DN4663_c0_g1~~TRINITY_DN4663_c0_g1_i2.p1  ORF type:complete len:290 (-),score=45.40 TRINITY_DN4663_c0_g1_i2:203-1072(-)